MIHIQAARSGKTYKVKAIAQARNVEELLAAFHIMEGCKGQMGSSHLGIIVKAGECTLTNSELKGTRRV